MSSETPASGIAPPASGPSSPDPRDSAFCSSAVPDLFHAIAHQHEIWRRDPYDVETIHTEARDVFTRLLDRVTTPPGLPAGRILLLLGESGSGKTHLLRAFRNQVHDRRLGYCGYLQMTAVSQFDRYVLGKVLDSLEQPYLADEGDTSGLLRLANGVVETTRAIIPPELARLRDAPYEPAALAHFVTELADLVVQEDRFADLDIDLVRAMLFLQRRDAPVRNRVMRWLRCEDLSERDRHILGGMVPRLRDEDPPRILTLLGRTMATVQEEALVVCIDQFDDLNNSDDAERQFRRAMTSICSLADALPSSLFVIACLADNYEHWRKWLTQSYLDRLARDPEPMRLTSPRNAIEVEQLIARRLMCLYDSGAAPFREEQPIYPFPAAEVAKLSGLRTRDVLDWCRVFRERCILSGRIVGEGVPPPQALVAPPVGDLAQLWNEAQAAPIAGPTEEDDFAKLLGWAIGVCSNEITSGHCLGTTIDGRMLEIEVQAPDNCVQKLLAGICNGGAQGGKLLKQIKEVEKRTGENVPILVRTTEFPASKTKVGEEIGKFIERGGRRVVVPDADWRTMRVFQGFHQQHHTHPQFAAWVQEDCPLTRLKSLRDLLDLDHLPSPAPKVETPRANTNPQSAIRNPQWNDPLLLGTSLGLQPEPITLAPSELIRHAAFLGGSGSGKTTLALNVIEQLLLRGVPALLLDRKGDLGGYARPEVWSAPLDDPERLERREQLRQRVETAVYTPGNPAGRPLSIPLVPAELEQLPSADRETLAHFAAAALTGMMGYKDRPNDRARLAILKMAINLICDVIPSAELTLAQLVQFLDGPDPKLLNEMGRLDAKNCGPFVQDLEALRLTKKDLLSAEGEKLQVESLLGLGPAARPDRTRLCIISTKFLGDTASIEFWVAQLLLELYRYANRHPEKELQAILLFDEADMYLPAQRKPATKQPMENLLKRSRSAGLGILLASQSPGDFDYKCRDNVSTWLLGKITQTTSIGKMKPLWSNSRMDLKDKLPQQEPGQFYLVNEGEPIGLRAQRSFLATEQLADDVITALARASRPVGER